MKCEVTDCKVKNAPFTVEKDGERKQVCNDHNRRLRAQGWKPSSAWPLKERQNAKGEPPFGTTYGGGSIDKQMTVYMHDKEASIKKLDL